MQLSDIRTRVSVILQDTLYDKWNSAEVIQAINDAYREFTRRTRMLPLNSRMRAVAGPAVYTCASSLLVNDVSLLSTGGIRLDRATLLEVIDTFGEDWQNVSGSPNYYVHPYDMDAAGNPRTLLVPNPGGLSLSLGASLVTGNSISGSITVTDLSGAATTTAVGPLAFSGSSAATWTALAALIDAVLGVATAVASGTSITVTESADYRVQLNTFTVTGGASQPVITSTVGLQDVRVVGTALPPALVGDTDVPQIHEMYHECLVWGAVARCYMKDFEYSDPNKRAYYESRFEAVIAEASRMTARGFARDPKLTKTSFF